MNAIEAEKRSIEEGIGFLVIRGEDESLIGGLTKIGNTELGTLTFFLHFGTHKYVRDLLLFFTLPARNTLLTD